MGSLGQVRSPQPLTRRERALVRRIEREAGVDRAASLLGVSRHTAGRAGRGEALYSPTRTRILSALLALFGDA